MRKASPRTWIYDDARRRRGKKLHAQDRSDPGRMQPDSCPWREILVPLAASHWWKQREKRGLQVFRCPPLPHSANPSLGGCNYLCQGVNRSRKLNWKTELFTRCNAESQHWSLATKSASARWPWSVQESSFAKQHGASPMKQPASVSAMETQHEEPPENNASFIHKCFDTRLIGFEMKSMEMTSTQPSTDHGNHLPLWATAEEQERHQVPKSSSTKAVVEGGSFCGKIDEDH